MTLKTLNEVTKEWLTAVLHDHGTLPANVAADEITLQPMGEGVGMMSAMSRIDIRYSSNDHNAPVSLVIKLPAENDTNRAVAEQFNLYMKETRYYQELAPLTEARSPKVYFSDIDDDQNFVLLMEDASEYRMGNQVTGASLHETEICIDELATLHASFWGKIEGVDWLPHISNSDNATNMIKGAEVGWPQMMEYFGEFVPDEINNKRDEYLNSIASQQAQLNQDPITFIHGDFRMDNMLFGRMHDHHPLLIVDFQGPLKAKGMEDFAYLLSHSCQTRVRQNHERQLLRRYVDGLQAGGSPTTIWRRPGRIIDLQSCIAGQLRWLLRVRLIPPMNGDSRGCQK